jgi:hypothetical protein
MLADEERVDGGDPGIEVVARGFEVLRTVVMKDHGPLAGDGHGVVGGVELGGGRGGQEGGEELAAIVGHRTTG